MLINNNYNSPNIIPNRILSKNNVSVPFNKGLTRDVFEKTTLTFKGSIEEDFFGMLIDKAFSIIEEATESFINDFQVIAKQTRREAEVATYIEALSAKNVRKLMLSKRSEKMTTLNSNIFYGLDFDIDFINNLFEQANIKTVLGLDNFIRTYLREPETKQIFRGQEIEAVKIYGLLESKDDLSKYSELLLYLYNQEEDSETPDYSKLNTTIAFLKKLGVDKFNEFDGKFEYLKSKFNDFDTVSDKVDAIEYLQTTYDAKTSLLDNVLKGVDVPKNQDSQKVYALVNDIVDYFYDKNDGKSLDGLEEVLDYALQQNKIKSQSLKSLTPICNDFKSPEDKISLFGFLKDNSISISDLNILSGRSIVSDSDNLAALINKEHLGQSIAEIRGTDESNGFNFYKNFRDIINAVYDESESLDGVRTFISVADRFNFKNSDSVLQFYNRAAEAKKRSLTSDEVKDFIELFKYSDSTTLFADAKAQSTSVVDLLAEEKQKYISVKEDIDNFCYSDNNAFFAGQSSLEIYKKYRELILSNVDNVSSVLQNIADFDIKNSGQYIQRTMQVEPFTKFFADKESMLKFFAQNNVKFDDTYEDNVYQRNCMEIFDSLYDENDKQKSYERINYFANSGFLVKSQTRLTEFLEKMPSSDVRKDVLSVIADKKVPSVNILEKFFKQYKSSLSDGVELLEYLRNLPSNIDFSKSSDILDFIQSKINMINVPVQINSENINRINIEDFAEKEIPTNKVISLLNNLYSLPDNVNFLSALSSELKSKPIEFSSYRIAQELAAKIDRTDESYQNISRLLKLDKHSLGLPDDCSSYIYVKAIEKALPKNFINFVNSEDWTTYSDDKSKGANLVLHAKLRAIDRFALNDADSIDVLYTDEMKSRLQNLFKTVYTTSPVSIKGSDSSKRLIVDFVHESNVIEAIFLDKGEMITIVPKRNGRNF